MFCSNCGNRMGEGAKFCENCGTPAFHFQNPANSWTSNSNMTGSGIMNGNVMQQAAGHLSGQNVPQIVGQNISQAAVQTVGQTVSIAHGIGKKAKYVAAIGIVIAGLTAFLNTYVSGPDQTLKTFCSACNEGNFNEALECLDETSEKTVRGTVDITMEVVNGTLDMVGLGAFGMDGDTVIDMMPSMWSLMGMSEEIPEIEVSDLKVAYEGNEFLDFLKSVKLDLDGFYNVFAKEAEVEAVLEIGGESETVVFKMENENFGKWKINLSDMLKESR